LRPETISAMRLVTMHRQPRMDFVDGSNNVPCMKRSGDGKR
jgi:hypothetical protein